MGVLLSQLEVGEAWFLVDHHGAHTTTFVGLQVSMGGVCCKGPLYRGGTRRAQVGSLGNMEGGKGNWM